MEEDYSIKILKTITREEYGKIREECKNSTIPPLDITLQDLGFCIKHDLNEEDQKKWDELMDKCTDIEENGLSSYSPERMTDKEREEYEELRLKKYGDFKYIEPGYLEDTLGWAYSHNSKLKEPIKKGSRIYFTYPLSCVVVVEILSDITDSRDFVSAFCDAYIEIYRLEEESSKNKAMPICEENPESHLMNRNRTTGCFGIWGHDLGDLVLEAVEFAAGGKHIFLVIGS